MKTWYIGVDGGGTKTEIAASRRDGVPVASIRRSGCSYQELGVEGAVSVVVDGITSCLESIGALLGDCAGCCLGIPCFGECAEHDAMMVKQLQERLAPVPVYVVNDVEVGWAGSLACQAGVHIVAGTGAIAFGKDSNQRAARCGGWHEFFGDEGSCYWVGREAMSIFSKEADGRLPKQALYEIVRKDLALSEDYDFIDHVVNEIAPRRDMVAAFQLYASKAAKEGDIAVRSLYDRAAQELASLAGALRKQLSLPDGTKVSYSGGLFQNGNLILEPFGEALAAYGFKLQAPIRGAVEGALMLAIERFKSEEI